MKRVRLYPVVLVGMVIWALAGLATLQAQATPEPATNWPLGSVMRIKDSVPFVWLRDRPASDAATIVGVDHTSADGILIAATDPVWDGVQWWWYTSYFDYSGYVEQRSLIPCYIGPSSGYRPGTCNQIATPTATGQATPTAPGKQAQLWVTGTLLRTKASLPFVWLRLSPSSASAPADTVNASNILEVSAGTTISFWDGVQWWWVVHHRGSSNTGWVEQDRVEAISSSNATPTATAASNIAAANWQTGSVQHVRSGVPFVWLRSLPSSSAGVQGTMLTGASLTIVDSVPVWDGAQWWWYVSGNVRGWVEQNAMLQPSTTT